MGQDTDDKAIANGRVNGIVTTSLQAASDLDLKQRRTAAFEQPGNPGAWRALGRALREKGERVGGAAAFARSITASLSNPTLIAIEKLIRDRKLADASHALEKLIAADENDVVALRLAGDVASRTGKVVDAERHYRQCIDLCPSYVPARYGLTRLLLRQARLGEASNESERMLATAPTDPTVRTLKAAIAASVGNHADAAGLYKGLLHELPQQSGLWLGLGHSQRTLGKTDEAIAAYRKTLANPTGAAEAYWSLSNLKTYRFDDADLGRMEELATDTAGQQAAFIHFALGQALDARGETERAFDHYARGNAAKRATITYDATRAEERLARWTASVTADMLASHSGAGASSPGPIFIVGLPRSGSTLVEQILGSHSLIENTSELPYMDRIASKLARSGMMPGQERTAFDLAGVDLAELGHEYLSGARAHRKTPEPFFIDKLPGNFAHAALIKLMLPNAKIIDVRRHPLATTWSVFKQLFMQGQPFAYDLAEIARWYRSYVAAMTRFNTVMPGAVLHLGYEDLIEETEAQVRRLLEHVGVAFEPGCLAFHESGNAVRTPSSEQVRQPIFRHGLAEWRRYEPHLQPAVDLLTAEIASYRSPERIITL